MIVTEIVDCGRNVNVNGWQSSRFKVNNSPLDYFFDEILVSVRGNSRSSQYLQVKFNHGWCLD